MERRYSLPNCTLAIEGLSSTIGDLSGTPIVSTLVNAECYLQGREQPLSGGREFLESLIRSVSQYAQSILSGVRPPESPASEVVRIAPVEGHHRLSIAASDNGATPAEVDLSTVVLFDLVEAIDQLLADANTLPELTVPLQPLSRQYSNTNIPLTTRAAAPAMGLSTLALAALVFALVPVPEKVERPIDPIPEDVESVEGDGLSSAGSGTGTDDPPSRETDDDDAVELSPTLETTPDITDPDRIAELNEDLYAQIDETWEDRASVVTDLSYRVSVSDDGTIIGYKADSGSAEYYDSEIPLQDLVYIPTEGGRAEAESLAEFKVVFRDDGTLEVSPWDGDSEDRIASDSEVQTRESQTEESRFDESEPEEADTRESQTDESRFDASDDEEADTRKSETEESRFDESEPEEADTDESRFDTSDDEESDSRKSDTDESRTDESSREDSDSIEDLWAKTQGFLYDEWADLPRATFEERLEYRVGVSEDGELAQVEPINQPAFDYIYETPLDGVKRVAPGDRNDPEDLEFFKVVFTPGGVIEMNPWDGVK